MTTETEARGEGQRRFDFVRLVAPMLAIICLAMVLLAESSAHRIEYFGQALAMISLSLYVFHLRGCPIPQRPPVRFTRPVIGMIAVFCSGMALAGAGLMGWPDQVNHGLYGWLKMLVPSALFVLLALFLMSPGGKRYRARLADGAT